MLLSNKSRKAYLSNAAWCGRGSVGSGVWVFLKKSSTKNFYLKNPMV